MNYLFIQYGNTIISVNHICSAQMKRVGIEDAKFLGLYEEGRSNGSILHVYTRDGKDNQFVNEDAEAMWEWLKNTAVTLLPEQD
jgi:hypothetical protein